MELLPVDRCDRCQARARIRVANVDHAYGVLDFCLHHFQKIEADLMTNGWYVVATA